MSTDPNNNLFKKLEAGAIVADKWQLKCKLGEGVYGSVFKCQLKNEAEPDKIYAMKVQHNLIEMDSLTLEVCVYRDLGANKMLTHFPYIIDFGSCNDFKYLVMSLIGLSLHDLRKDRPGQKFSMRTSLAIAIQTLESLNQLHGTGWLHRDIKPANFAIGLGNDNGRIYMLDFGMARKFVKDGFLKRPREGVIGFRGTLKYASVTAHAGRELCRADDVESWFYMIAEFIKGKLPWSTYEDVMAIFLAKKNARNQESEKTKSSEKTPMEDGLTSIMETGNEKMSSPRRALLGGTPRQFGKMHDLISHMRYYDTPPYDELTKLLTDAQRTTKVKLGLLDWQKVPKV